MEALENIGLRFSRDAATGLATQPTLFVARVR
jgi:hypothetical protein